MIEVTGKLPHAIQDAITQGPSGTVNHYEPVTMDCQGSSFHDDDLSLADLDVISGAVKIYTGKPIHHSSERLALITFGVLQASALKARMYHGGQSITHGSKGHHILASGPPQTNTGSRTG